MHRANAAPGAPGAIGAAVTRAPRDAVSLIRNLFSGHVRSAQHGQVDSGRGHARRRPARPPSSSRGRALVRQLQAHLTGAPAYVRCGALHARTLDRPTYQSVSQSVAAAASTSCARRAGGRPRWRVCNRNRNRNRM